MEKIMSDGATAQLARFVCETSYENLPPSALNAARRALVNIIGCCLSGAQHPIVETAARALLPFSGKEQASLIGRPERTDILTATLLNSLSSAAYSFDDTHAETMLHPSGVVAATLLAIAEHRALSGKEFLLAFVLGVDVASRISKATSVAPASAEMGWSQTGIAAGIGAAAAASKALGLDLRATLAAISISSLQASGNRVAHGTMSATLIFGHTAQCGLRSALLAREGLSAPLEPLTGKYGYASLFARPAYLPYLTDLLGRRYEIEALTYKPYPCGIVIHPAIDAALEWRRAREQGSESIEAVRLYVHPDALALGYRRHPTNPLEAKVSLCHWTAAAFAFGRATLSEVQTPAIDDPEVTRLRGVIELQIDDALASEASVLNVACKDGGDETITIDRCKGSISNPMSDDDLVDKFLGQAHLTLSPIKASRVMSACWDIDKLKDASQICRLSSRT
jgi:2-methylcitrate dehydratase PrpD